jgi:hypothetical protein
MKLDDLTLLALVRGISTKDYNAASDRYPDGIPGTQIDETVRVYGTVARGENFEKETATAIPWQEIACALLTLVSPDVMDKALKMARNKGINAKMMAETHPRCSAAVKELQEASRKETRGSVRVVVEIVPVHDVPTLARTAETQDARRR